MLGDTVSATRSATEAVRHLTPIEDSWGLVHAEAMLGAVADAEHRFADAAAALTRAAELSERLGFVGQAALHLTTLGRVQQRSGAPDQAADTLARAIQAATTGGDLRIAATAGSFCPARYAAPATRAWRRPARGNDAGTGPRVGATGPAHPLPVAALSWSRDRGGGR